ncbi:MAG: TetR/AcrR family transcriptional regulator [Nocardiopsaceae bacterium]|nr:TetR/AcrR family transcriptional regulator [Nocardiopsaceae bacterium]
MTSGNRRQPAAAAPTPAAGQREPADQTAGEGPSIWQRAARPAPAPRTTLTYDQIAQAAIALADAEGLGAVSMRRLASHLGVVPMAFYRYVSSKDDIIELMVDTVRSDGPTSQSADWRDVMRASARQIRAATLSHPWLLEVSGRAAIALTPNGLAAIERALSSIGSLGLDIGVTMDVVLAVGAYARGAAQAEISLSQVRTEQWCTGEGKQPAYPPGMKWLLDTGRYPTFQHYLSQDAGTDHAEARFEFGLHCLLDGISARLGI